MDQDQLDEIEAISAIFADEFSEMPLEEAKATLTANGWADEPITHVVLLSLQPQPDDKGQIHVAARLVCAMPQGYPAERPLLLACEGTKGLSDSHLEELVSAGRKAADETAGMPSIFTVAEAIREWLQTNNLPGLDGSMYSDMLRRMQQKEVEKKMQVERAAIKHAADTEKRAGDTQVDEAELERIRKRQAGTQVTMETFVAWKKAFDEEMAARKAQDGEATGLDAKLTGRQWFLQQQAAGGGTGDLADEDEFLAQQAALAEAEGDNNNDEDDDEEGNEDGSDTEDQAPPPCDDEDSS